MSNLRTACIGALVFPAVPLTLVVFDIWAPGQLTPLLLLQSHATGAALAVALFGK